MDRLEEAIRLVIETRGREGIDALRDALAGVGDVSEETLGATNQLLDSLDRLNDTADKAARFEDMTRAIGETEEKLAAASQAALQLSLQLGATEKPSRELVRAQKAARDEVSRLEDALEKQYAALARADAELGDMGFNVADLANSQRRLRDEIGRTAAAVERQSQSVRREGDAQRQLAQRLEEGDEAFRKQAEASRVSREALERYRAGADQATDATENLSASAQSAGRVFGRLRSIAAAAFGFLSFRGLAQGFKSIVSEGAESEQVLRQIEATLQSTGRQAEYTAQDIRALVQSMDTGLFDVDEIVRANAELLSYTNIVGDMYPKALQVAIDQATRLGTSVSQAAQAVGTALQLPSKAMQSLARQGFILEDSQRRMIEQMEATGRTAEAQQIILDLLVESYGGAAAAAKVGTMAGLWQTVRENFKDFQTDIANRGVLEYFKNQLTSLLATTDRLAKDGTLGRWAQRTADAIVSVAEAVKNSTRFLIEHRGALLFLGKAYAALKIGQAVVAMNGWRLALLASTRAALAKTGALDKTTAAATRLRLALRAIPGSIAIGVALVGVDAAIKGARSFGEWLGKNSKAAKDAADTHERMRETMRAEAQQRAELMAQYAEFRETIILTSRQVAKLSEEEREAYEERLAGLREYLRAQVGYLLRQKELGLATEEQLKTLAELPARLAAVRNGYAAIADGARTAANALRNTLTPAAQVMREELEGIADDAKLANQSIRQMFDGLNYRDSNTLGDVALALASIAEEGAGADRSVRDGLQATLRQLSGEDLARFQASAQAAFAEFGTQPAAIAAILDSTLIAAMERLGVSADQMGVRFTDSGKDAVAAFGAILENANATGAQIETAFKAALSRVATLDEAAALGALLKSAGEQGKIGFDQAERAAAALGNRVRQIEQALNPLNDAFATLGIRSQAELDRARDAARTALQQIAEGVRAGTASIEDQRRAVAAYAETARAAVADSDQAAKNRVEAEIRVLEAIHQVNQGLREQGATGLEAGERVAQGARTGAEGLSGLAATAGKAAQRVAEVGEAANAAAAGIRNAGAASADSARQVDGMAVALGGLTDEAVRALMGVNRFAGNFQVWNSLWNTAMRNITDQQQAVQGLNAELDEQLARMDPLNKDLERLKQQYQFVDEAELRTLAQKRQQMDQHVERQREEARRAREDADRAAAEAARAREAAGDGPALSQPLDDTLTIRWEAPSKSVATAANAAEVEQAERIADLVLPRLVQRLERARARALKRHH